MRALILLCLASACKENVDGASDDAGGGDGDGASGRDDGGDAPLGDDAQTEDMSKETGCDADPSYSGPDDFAVPHGWFFTQRGCGPGIGFSVTDEPHPATSDGPARFYTFFLLMGGVDGLGYPRSSRFVGGDGRVRQLFDAGLVLADPSSGETYFDDVLARASSSENTLLATLGVPAPDETTSMGTSAISAAWAQGPANPAWCPFGASDSQLLYGNPTSALIDGHQRFERVVFMADGTLATLGEALMAAAKVATSAQATYIPPIALEGEAASLPLSALTPLRDELETMLDGYAGDVAVAVTDLLTFETIDIHGDRKQTSASTVKWWMITAALKRLDDGTASYTLAEIDTPIRNILAWSSNTDASTIVGLVGGDFINHHMLWQGMTRSAIVQWWPYTNACYSWPSEDSYFNWNNHLTVRDTNRGLAALYSEWVLSTERTDWFLDVGIELTPYWYFGSYFPAPPRSIAWTHKVGFIPPEAYGPEDEALNDVGIVFVNDRGYAFALSILSLNNADHNAADEFLAEIGLVVLEHLDDLYPK